MPGPLKEALVVSCELVVVGWENVTRPGPTTLVQVKTGVEPGGRASSEAVPVKVMSFGITTLWSGPALAVGGLLVATETVRSSNEANEESDG